jgi:hypothetical protein
VTQRQEILTYVSFGSTGVVSNSHDVRQGTAVTRLGWTLLDPKLAVPGFHPDFIAMQPLRIRMKHWWRLKTAKSAVCDAPQSQIYIASAR